MAVSSSAFCHSYTLESLGWKSSSLFNLFPDTTNGLVFSRHHKPRRKYSSVSSLDPLRINAASGVPVNRPPAWIMHQTGSAKPGEGKVTWSWSNYETTRLTGFPTVVSRKASQVTAMPKSLVTYNFDYAIVGPCIMKDNFACISLGFYSPCMGSYSLRAVHSQKEVPNVTEACKEQTVSDLSEKANLAGKTELENHALEYFESEDDKETQRRRKISHGNIGKVPWNKGHKHSEETRMKIKQRTIEALKDPKVRKKMSERQRSHRPERIRASLTSKWSQRLQWKRSSEKFMESWAQAIAKAAKTGLRGQLKLEWNSYEKLKRKIALQQEREAAERAKAKEMAYARAERAAQLKAEKMALLEAKRKERELNAQMDGTNIRKWNRRSKEELENLAKFREVKLKEKLMKIHRKKSMIVSNQVARYWGNLDVDLVKGEQVQEDISLEDQIRNAKNLKAEQLLDKL